MTSISLAFTMVVNEDKLYFCETVADHPPQPAPPSSALAYSHGVAIPRAAGLGYLVVKVGEEWDWADRFKVDGQFRSVSRMSDLFMLNLDCEVIKAIVPPMVYKPRAVLYHDTVLEYGEYKVGDTLKFLYSHTTRSGG